MPNEKRREASENLIGFGALDVGVGIAMGITGVGGIPGAALVFVGIDHILQGSLNMRYGRVGKNLSVIEDFVFRNTGSETLAVLTPGALSLGLGWYGSLARAAAREAAGMAMPTKFIFEHGLPGGLLMRTAVAELTAAEVAAARATESWWTLLSTCPRITP